MTELVVIGPAVRSVGWSRGKAVQERQHGIDEAGGWSILTAWPAEGMTPFSRPGSSRPCNRRRPGTGCHRPRRRSATAPRSRAATRSPRRRAGSACRGRPGPGPSRRDGVAPDRSRLDACRTRQALTLEPRGGVVGAPVPGVAGVVLLEPRTGVDDQERANPLRIGAIKRERHVTAERKPADDGACRRRPRRAARRCRRWSGPRCRPRGPRDSRTGRGRACPTGSTGGASTAPRSGRATSVMSMNNRGSGSVAAHGHGPRSRA